MALLHDKNGDRHIHLHEGESLPDGSIKLVEVKPRSAVFDSSAGRAELKLPAGAPIDQPKAAVPGMDVQNSPPGDAIMRVEPRGNAYGRPAGGGHTPARPAPAAFERLRENIQKRRAAAAAANEGVR